MFEKIMNLPSDIWQWIWHFIVSFIGGTIGYITKVSPIVKNKPLKEKLTALLLGITNSMFIAYISYELLVSILESHRLAIALSGMAAFTGTDLLIIIQNKMLEVIKRKMDSL